jgi:hypothetical protein
MRRIEKKLNIQKVNLLTEQRYVENKDSIKRIDENDKPPYIGTNHNEVNILYNLTGDDYSYVPANLKYLSINTDNTSFNTQIPHFTDEEQYQESIKRKDFFFIYYNGNRYLYLPHHKILFDKSANKIIGKDKNPVFNDQMNRIIYNTVN